MTRSMRGDRASRECVATERARSASLAARQHRAPTGRLVTPILSGSLRADMIFGNDRSTMNIPSEYRIASIGSNHAMILPYYANPKADGIFEQDRALIGYSICRLSDTASEIKNSNGSSFGNLWHRMREK